MILALLQARMSSTRLPGKVLLPICGKPMIMLQVERIRRARHIDRLIVATSSQTDDAPLAEACQAADVECFRGDLDDVLDRFRQAARPLAPDHVVRLTGDCPLTDAAVIDAVIDFHLAGRHDYTSNALEPTWPDGLDVEIFRHELLETAWQRASLPSEREHVTPYMYNGGRYRIAHCRNDKDLSALRWTVDEPEDLAFVTAVFERLYENNPAFAMADVLALLQRFPELGRINAHIGRNEGYQKSLQQDLEQQAERHS